MHGAGQSIFVGSETFRCCHDTAENEGELGACFDRSLQFPRVDGQGMSTSVPKTGQRMRRREDVTAAVESARTAQ